MKKSVSVIVLLLSVLTVFGCTSATRSTDFGPAKKEVRTSLEQALDHGGTSVSYAVIQNGNLALADAVGYLDSTAKTATTVDTLYNIGSLSKVFTSVAVMKLIEAGAIDLDDPVVQHLPYFKLNDDRSAGITVRMLLNHSSGLLGSDYPTGITFGGYDRNYYDKYRSYLEKSVLRHDPGKFSAYCNDGFEVAELLVANKSGMTFDRFVSDTVFKPLGLSSAGYANRSFASGSYAIQGSLPQEFPNVMGSGGISINLTDLARFGVIFLNGGGGVLTPSSIQAMNSPQGKTFIPGDTGASNFGFGWDHVTMTFDDYNFGEGILFKSGGTSQFTSYLYVIPAYNISAAISVTMDYSGDAAATLRSIIANVLRAQGIETARAAAVYTPPTARALPADFGSQYAGYYGSKNNVTRVTVTGATTISIEESNGGTFSTKYASLIFDGESFVKTSGEKVCRFVPADGRNYLMSIYEAKKKVVTSGQKLEPSATMPGTWENRLNRLYLPAEVDYNAIYLMPGLKLVLQEGLNRMLFMQEGSGSKIPLSILDDYHTGIVLSTERDLKTVWSTMVNGEEWLACPSYNLRPASSLPSAQPGTVTIAARGENQLYRLPQGKLVFTVPAQGRVVAYSDVGDQVYDSRTQGVDPALLPQSGYIRFVGLPGVQFTVTLGQ